MDPTEIVKAIHDTNQMLFMGFVCTWCLMLLALMKK